MKKFALTLYVLVLLAFSCEDKNVEPKTDFLPISNLNNSDYKEIYEKIKLIKEDHEGVILDENNVFVYVGEREKINNILLERYHDEYLDVTLNTIAEDIRARIEGCSNRTFCKGHDLYIKRSNCQVALVRSNDPGCMGEGNVSSGGGDTYYIGDLFPQDEFFDAGESIEGGGSTTGSSSGGNSGVLIIKIDSERQLRENLIDLEQDSEIRRILQLQYLNDFGGLDGKEFKKAIDDLLHDKTGLTVGDVVEINSLVSKMYLSLKAEYIMAIFSTDNVSAIIGFALTPNISNTLRTRSFNVIPRYLSKSTLGQGYSSFTAFKNAHGSAGTGKAWHHIVSQRSSNVSKFGSSQIHNTKNLIKIPHGAGSWHQRITNFYNTISPQGINTNGLRFGEWLAQKSFQEQLEWGLKVMEWMK